MPESFLQAVEKTEQRSPDLNDPIFNNPLYQEMADFQLAPTKKVRQLIEQAQSDHAYADFIRDTIHRCKEDIARDSGIQNKAGYLMSAIENDYHKEQRTVDEKLLRNQQLEKEHQIKETESKAEQERIEKEIYDKRRPLLEKLRAEHLNDQLVKEVLASKAKNSFISEKLFNGYKNGKKSRILDAWVDECLLTKQFE